jgi:hypothetical protein
VITGYIEGESIRAGDLVKLRCTAMRGNPPATLKWFKGKLLQFSNNYLITCASSIRGMQAVHQIYTIGCFTHLIALLSWQLYYVDCSTHLEAQDS